MRTEFSLSVTDPCIGTIVDPIDLTFETLALTFGEQASFVFAEPTDTISERATLASNLCGPITYQITDSQDDTVTNWATIVYSESSLGDMVLIIDSSKYDTLIEDQTTK